MNQRHFLLLLFLSLSFALNAQKQKIILDADTGNEVDDLYAVARVLLEPSLEVTALNATQWEASHWSIPNTMENSHRLNQMLLGYTGAQVKTRRGGVDRMFDWGDLAQHSAAAYEIIQQAKALPAGEQIKVIALGALTNVASAIYIDPTISSKLDLYWLGTSYDFEKGVLSRTDFNCIMDVQALDLLLNSEVKMHIIPVSLASQMNFTFEESQNALRGKHPLGDFLLDRWVQHLDGGRAERTIWDLALIEAVIHPEMAKEVEVETSRDSGGRKLFYYQSIEVEKMKADFFAVMQRFFEKNK